METMTETTTTSPEIAELAKALAAAQGEIEAAKKDSTNPHFNSKYADLASVWEACRGPLTKNGLAVVQVPINDGARVGVETLLLHTSGQFVRGRFWAQPREQSPQALGSCLTYCRRYSLSAFVGVAPDDDDGNAAYNEGAPAGGRARSTPPRRAAEPAGAPEAQPRASASKPPPTERASGEQLNEILECFKILEWSLPHQRTWVDKHAGVKSLRDLNPDQAAELIEKLALYLAEKKAENQAAAP